MTAPSAAASASHTAPAATGNAPPAAAAAIGGSPTPSTDHQKRFDTLRDYLKHEDALVNHRITWNLTTQGFLFTAFGFCLQKADTNPMLRELAGSLLPIAGCIISLCATSGIFAAHLALANVGRHWRPEDTAYLGLPDIRGGGARSALIVGLLASFGPALLIATIWSVICMRLHGVASRRSIFIGTGGLLALVTILIVWHLWVEKRAKAGK